MGNLPQMRAKCLVKIENTWWQYLQSPPGPRLYFWGPKSPNPASDQIQKANPTHLLLMQRKQKVISYASLRHYSCLKATRHSQNHRTTSSQEDETPNFIKTCIPLTITIHSGISKNLVHEFQPSIFRAERKQIGLLLFGIVKAQMKSFWQSSSRSELYVPCPSSRPSYDRVMKMVSDGRIPGQQHAWKHDSCHLCGSTQRLKVESNTSHSPSQHPLSSPDSHPLMPRHHRSQGSTIHRNVFPMVPLCQSTAKSVLRVKLTMETTQ